MTGGRVNTPASTNYDESSRLDAARPRDITADGTGVKGPAIPLNDKKKKNKPVLQFEV